MVFFTADTHFGHANIIRFCNRPFDSVEEMNEALISNWNSRVRGNDTVFIVGDMMFRCPEPELILKRLKGKKRLIVGNHDSSWMNKVDLTKFFYSVDPYLEISDGQHALTLCHYPLLSWKHQKRSYMIHGHIHADTSMDYWPQIASRDNLLNAGCDINNYMPVTFDELFENNRAFKQHSAISKTMSGITDVFDRAYIEYSALTIAIEKGEIAEEENIERVLDGLLDFYADDRFKKLKQRIFARVRPYFPNLVSCYERHVLQMFEQIENDDI